MANTQEYRQTSEPLPFESELSHALFLAWWYGWDSEALLRHVERAGGALRTTVSVAWPRTGAENSTRASEFSSNAMLAPVVARYLRSSQLRICPLCMEAGFHCVLHQIWPLQQCPIHGCSMVAACQACGEPFLLATRSRLLFKTPYRCTACQKPWSGVAMAYGAREELRGQLTSIRRKLSPYADWVRKVGEQRFLNLFANDAPLNPKHPWQPEDRLLYSAATCMAPALPCMEGPLFKSMSILTWRSSLACERGVRGFKPVEAQRQLQLVRAVVERRVRRWLDSAARTPDGQHAQFAKALAATWQSSATTTLLPVSGLPIEKPSGEAPRLAVCAHQLGMAAAMIWCAHRYGHRAPDCCQVPLVSEEIDGWLCGWCFFPNVPGLSVRPFESSQRGIN